MEATLDTNARLLLMELARHNGLVLVDDWTFDSEFDRDLVNELSKQGLVRYTGDGGWGYRAGVELTGKGRELMGLNPVGFRALRRRIRENGTKVAFIVVLAVGALIYFLIMMGMSDLHYDKF